MTEETPAPQETVPEIALRQDPGGPEDPSCSEDLGCSEELGFRAVLTPHRSLGPRGFLIFMAVISVVSFGTGLLFFLMGAWPIMGFMGLDVLLVYIAFRVNFRALRIYETVDLTPETLTVTRVPPNGKERSWCFNPYWVRIQLEERVGRTSELSLVSHGKRFVFAAFLTDPEREDFAAALKAALEDARAPELA